MKKTFDTKFGKVTLRGAIIDTDGTNLVDGIEILIKGKVVGEVLGRTFSSVEDLEVDEVEELIEENVEQYYL